MSRAASGLQDEPPRRLRYADESRGDVFQGLVRDRDRIVGVAIGESLVSMTRHPGIGPQGAGGGEDGGDSSDGK